MEPSNWIFENNLIPLLRFVALDIGYQLEADEERAYLSEIANSDAENDSWAHIHLDGEKSCRLSLAPDRGTSVIRIKVEAEQIQRLRIQAICDFLSSFRVQ